MKDVTLNQKEQARLSVLNSVLEFHVPIADAAELLGVTQHHARRTLAACRERGAGDEHLGRTTRRRTQPAPRLPEPVSDVAQGMMFRVRRCETVGR